MNYNLNITFFLTKIYYDSLTKELQTVSMTLKIIYYLRLLLFKKHELFDNYIIINNIYC